MQKLDFTELHQYFNDFSASIREAGNQTSSSLLEVKGEMASLNANLTTTNYLLMGLLILNVVLLFVVFFKKSKQ
ncbi:hypothetical protein [Brevibacillus brevis]|uniref:hypothetical protein n=1 Tax=Brevibacillus brevis TaxID=1393 RepID=UPI00165D6539|nr:hypothetical protein [Brevibacillus brevis]